MAKKQKSGEPQQIPIPDTVPENEPLFISPKMPFAPTKSDTKQVALSLPVQLLVREKNYKSADQLKTVMERYFNDADLSGEYYSVEGLSLACGFSSTQSLANYGQAEGYEEFHELVKSAKLRILSQRVSLAMRGKMHPTLFIFLAANNSPLDYQRDPVNKTLEAFREEIELNYTQPNQDAENTNEPEADRKAG